NVETEQNSPHSLLWWMKRMIVLRKRYLSFSHGSLEFLTPENNKVLAFVRRLDGEQILVVANLSRFVQCVELDLSAFKGEIPVELFGHTRFPAIGELPYFLTLGPYSFYWFSLVPAEPVVAETPKRIPTCRVGSSWAEALEGTSQSTVENALPDFLAKQRW